MLPGVPAASVQMAEHMGVRGCISRSLRKKGFQLHHGAGPGRPGLHPRQGARAAGNNARPPCLFGEEPGVSLTKCATIGGMSSDSQDPPETPRAPAPTETLVLDAGSHRQLLRIAGLLPLPIGARIELGSLTSPPVSDGVVTAVRLWGAESAAPLLVLEVMLTEPGAASDLP